MKRRECPPVPVVDRGLTQDLVPVPIGHARRQQRKIVKLQQIVDAQRKHCDEMYDAIPKRIVALDISDSLKNSAIEGYVEKLAPGRERTKKILEADHDFFDECDHLADFMHDRLGRFRI